MAAVTVEYYGVEGTGRNVTEAKRNAGAKIERLVKAAGRSPEVVAFGGYAYLVWQEGDTVRARIVADPDGVRVGVLHGTEYADWKEALRDVRRHLAQLGCDTASDEVPGILAGDAEGVREWRAYQDTQRRFLRAKAAGAESGEQHEYACRGPRYGTVRDKYGLPD